MVIVTDAANVFALLGEQAQPEILDGVRVLIFVDENIFKLGLIFFEDIAVVLQQIQAVQQQIAKVAGVQGKQTRLIERVHPLALTIGESLIITSVQICR